MIRSAAAPVPSVRHWVEVRSLYHSRRVAFTGVGAQVPPLRPTRPNDEGSDIDKKGAPGVPALTLAVLVLAEVLSLAGGQLLWKKGIDAAGGFMMPGESVLASIPRLLQSPAFLIGCGLYLVAMLLWFYLLARFDLSFIYPLVSLTFVVASLGGWLFLGEPLTVQRALGIAVIALGVTIVTRS
jgi:multidrug transporter EmrE-like cation transporter